MQGIRRAGRGHRLDVALCAALHHHVHRTILVVRHERIKETALAYPRRPCMRITRHARSAWQLEENSRVETRVSFYVAACINSCPTTCAENGSCPARQERA